MNILFVYRMPINPTLGGVERVTSALAGFFEKKGHNVSYLSLLREEAATSSRQNFLPDSDRFLSAKNVKFFLEYLVFNKIDVVINQGGLDPENSQLAYFARGVGVKLLSVIHSSPLKSIKNFRAAFEYQFAKRSLGFLLAMADFSLARKVLIGLYRLKYGSHFTRLCKESDSLFLLSERYFPELLTMAKGIDRAKITGVPNPLPFIPTGISCKAKKLLYVGRVNTSSKRTDLLLRIWEKVSVHYQDWSLTIVGGGDELDIIKSIVSSRGLRDISFEGFQSPESYYKQASILCMTSAYEGFPMVLVEAMSYGVIPVAFNSFASVTDVIDDGQNGCLVEPFSVDKYVNILAQLIENDSLRARLSNAAIGKSGEFSLDKIGGEWLKKLESMLAST